MEAAEDEFFIPNMQQATCRRSNVHVLPNSLDTRGLMEISSSDALSGPLSIPPNGEKNAQFT